MEPDERSMTDPAPDTPSEGLEMTETQPQTLEHAYAAIFDAFLGEVLGIQLQALDHLEEELSTPIGRGLEGAMRRHHELAEGLGEGAAGSDPIGYRQAVSREVLEPLLATLREEDIGERVDEAFREADLTAAGMARELPTALGEQGEDASPALRKAPARLRRLFREFVFDSVPTSRLTAVEQMSGDWLAGLVKLGEATTRWLGTSPESDAARGLQTAFEELFQKQPISTIRVREEFAAALTGLATEAKREATNTGWDPASLSDRMMELANRSERREGVPAPVMKPEMVERIRGAVARIEAVVVMTEFQTGVDSAVARCLGKDLPIVCDLVEGPIRRAEARIREFHAEAGEAFGEISGGGTAAARARLAERVRAVLGEGRREIADLERDLRASDAPNRLESTADGFVGALTERLREVPEVLRILEHTEPDTADSLPKDTVSLDLREWAVRSFDAHLLDRVRDALLGVGRLQSSAPDLVHGADGVLAYNLEAAIDELTASPPSQELGVAAELVLGGLDRTADHLGRVAVDLEAQHADTVEVVRSSLGQGWADLRQRLSHEAALRGEVGDALTDLGRQALGTVARLQEAGQSAGTFAASLVRVAATRARALVRRGRRLAGIQTPEAGAIQHTMRALRDLDSAAIGLPFVYRRLFSVRSLGDPSLLAGRETDLEVLGGLWADWQAGRTSALALVGPFGGTLNSLLNGFEARLQGSVGVHRAELEERVLNEGILARILADKLPLDLSPGPESLDDLAAEIAEQLSEPTIATVERFEHTFLRTVEGTALAARALEFFSRTDGQVFWILSASAAGWEIVRRTEPQAARLVEVQSIRRLEPKELERAILIRHQRSGLPVHFDAGDAPSPVLARRLSSAESESERQGLLQEAFFSRLFDLTDGSVPLSLLYWLRSVEFDASAESIQVTLPEALEFGFLDGLSWDQIFTLQAFMEHASLTVDEHSAIFGSSYTTSEQVLESLGNLLLIEPAENSRRVGEPLYFSTVEPGERYQIRPVLVPVVLRSLRGRNLVD